MLPRLTLAFALLATPALARPCDPPLPVDHCTYFDIVVEENYNVGPTRARETAMKFDGRWSYENTSPLLMLPTLKEALFSK